MARLPPLLHRTYSPRVIPLEGGFAGLFQLDFTNQLFARKYIDPVLVPTCTDGVRTKLKVAVEAGRHNTVGIDLVAIERQRRPLLRGRSRCSSSTMWRCRKTIRHFGAELFKALPTAAFKAIRALLGGRDGHFACLLSAGRLRSRGILCRRRRTAASDRRPGHCRRRPADRSYLKRIALERVQPRAKNRVRDRRPEDQRPCRTAGPHGRRRTSGADTGSMRSSGAACFGPLSGEIGCTWHRPYHRRRAA